MPQANSTFSMPRATSPRASASTLPCSRRHDARRDRRDARRAAARAGRASRRGCSSGDAPQSRWASTATSTTSSTSAADRAGRPRAVWTPRAGSYTGPMRLEDPGDALPSIQCPIVCTRDSPVVRGRRTALLTLASSRRGYCRAVPRATVDGLSIAYDVIGDGRPWVITPGGRFSKDDPGIRELAQALAEHGNRVLIWDRPNCGESDVCFAGSSESQMQADTLAGLLDPPRHDAGDHRRRLGRRPGVAADRSPPPRRRRRARDVVDQRGRVRPDAARDALLRRQPARRLDRRAWTRLPTCPSGAR